MTSNINPFNTINKGSLMTGTSSHFRRKATQVLVAICRWITALWMVVKSRAPKYYQGSNRNSSNHKLLIQLTLSSRGPLDSSELSQWMSTLNNSNRWKALIIREVAQRVIMEAAIWVTCQWHSLIIHRSR